MKEDGEEEKEERGERMDERAWMRGAFVYIYIYTYTLLSAYSHSFAKTGASHSLVKNGQTKLSSSSNIHGSRCNGLAVTLCIRVVMVAVASVAIVAQTGRSAAAVGACGLREVSASGLSVPAWRVSLRARRWIATVTMPSIC